MGIVFGTLKAITSQGGNQIIEEPNSTENNVINGRRLDLTFILLQKPERIIFESSKTILHFKRA